MVSPLSPFEPGRQEHKGRPCPADRRYASLISLPSKCQAPMDHLLFMPLHEQLLEQRHQANGLPEFISAIGIPSKVIEAKGSGKKSELLGACNGFVYETYVKWSLAAFSNSNGGCLKIPSLDEDQQRRRIVRSDDWGNISFHDQSGKILAEIDLLCNYDHKGVFAPVIFEMSLAQHTTNYSLKRLLVGDLMGRRYEPFMCNIVGKGEAGEGLNIHLRNPQKRLIVLPEIPALRKIAEKIMREVTSS